MVSTPEPPDPVETAAAQSGYNIQTAMAQQGMNMVNQNNPWGSSTYSQTGTQTIMGPDGEEIVIPQYTQTTTLTPEQQAIFETTQQAQGNIADLAAEQSAFMSDYLGEPFSYDPGQHESWALGLYDDLNADQNAQEMEALRTQLINRGLTEGSAAYDAEMRNLMQGRQGARNEFLLDSYDTGFNTALTERNQPINELSALMSGSQVSMPQFQSTPQTGVAGVDYTGMVQDNYNAQVQQSNAAMGGLFGLLSSPFQMFSFG